MSTEPGPKTKRDPERTIARIRQAAQREFGIRGFDGTTMERVAARARVSKQIVYHYFGGKTELYKEVLRDVSRMSVNRLIEVDYTGLQPAEAIRAYLSALYDYYRDQPVAAVLTFDQGMHLGSHVSYHREAKPIHDRLTRSLDAALSQGKAEGTISAQISIADFEFMAILITCACASSRRTFAVIVDSDDLKLDDDAFWKDYAVSFILRAIRP